ncbi:DUF4391 domain-containing protein [Propionimicrobium sp. PCR01-08-3]|uniref:DUF4391 domain-containing protein n=1 Tax=Propionimicrobium sp. PCR01-08-3 TaxID=3052086 RepID=UPI00255CAEF2|nr:DUF4391 domain-containing protein [Propionimicrobium sp. PCR01-08-3]WIY82946.1 DUF4391 domain-containing protein [Propionimicrobium sp. PCR01-08-3]
MTDLLYQWPTAAHFGKRIPKEKFYEHATVSAALREKFVSEVARVTWEYKLAEATINLPDSDEVPEIQVFRVEAKGIDVSEPVLAAIDKAIPTPIIFEVTREAVDGKQVRMVAAHKQLGAGAPKISQYLTTGWQPADTERQLLPTAITLSALYAALLEPLTDVDIRPGEGMSEVADRLKNVGKLEREIKTLERKLRTEKQFNRKIELRRILKTKQAQLEQQR